MNQEAAMAAAAAAAAAATAANSVEGSGNPFEVMLKKLLQQQQQLMPGLPSAAATEAFLKNAKNTENNNKEQR